MKPTPNLTPEPSLAHTLWNFRVVSFNVLFSTSKLVMDEYNKASHRPGTYSGIAMTIDSLVT
jgi:hypothetical protein